MTDRLPPKNSESSAAPVTSADVPFQPASVDIWESKYRLVDHDGNPVDQTMDDTHKRVARALADAEVPEKREEWYEKFLWALRNGAIGAGRITSNAGAQKYKPATSLINCLAAGTPVLTDAGVFPIETLVGRPVRVLNGKGRWSQVAFRSFGKQATFEVCFRHGTRRAENALSIRATAGHRWILGNGKVITTEYWATGSTNNRHTVLPNIQAPRPEREDPQYARGVFHGLMYGDGTTNNQSKDYYVLDLVEKKAALSAWAEGYLGKPGNPTTYNAQGNTGLRWSFSSKDVHLKDLPPASASPAYVLGFFAGLLATDGSVHDNKQDGPKPRSTYVSVFGSEEVVDYLERMLPSVGITPTKKSLSLKKGTVNNFGVRQRDVFSLAIDPSSVDAVDILRPEHRARFAVTDHRKTHSAQWTFLSIQSYGEEEVFCCEEPETNSFVLGSGLLTGNCVVSGTIEDSMDSIMTRVYEGAMTLRKGSGIGYDMSTMRPRGAFVAGAGASTSGPLSFMDIYDKMCFTVASAGGRRGAQMATFDVGHPDVMDFIRAKREAGRLRQFNLSLLITDGFMKAVQDDAMWPLAFPIHQKEAGQFDLDNPEQILWREWPTVENLVVRESDGLVACRIYKTVKAQNLWNAIMTSTYDFAEPGFVLVDKVNEDNNNWWMENIRATNPCGEQGLPPFGACLLGSVNLTRFVLDPFTDKARFDWEKFRLTVRYFTRMLDNVVEDNNLPLPQQRDEITRKRRHGMGYLGLGSTLTMLKTAYGSPESLVFTDQVTKVLALVGWEVAAELSEEKGPAPALAAEYPVTAAMLRMRPEMVRDGYAVGDMVPGRILHARYSRYMQRIAKENPALVERLAQIGARFTHHSSIAPTGTISLSLGNNASNGIEPSFAHHYSRNVIRSGRKTKEKVDVFSFELLAYRSLVNPKAMPHSTDPEAQLPDYFISADEVSPKQHVDIQAAAQPWIDSAISKTANVPTDFPYEDFKDIYLYAYQKGLKGCTTFRFNPEAFQGVLVKEKDLENTLYTFRLEDGTEVVLKGNEEVVYDGETHTAANLFDALKEGYYGKF